MLPALIATVAAAPNSPPPPLPGAGLVAAGPWLLIVVVVLAWLSPFAAAIVGWTVLRDLPQARRRYRAQAAAWLVAYGAIVASGLVVVTRPSAEEMVGLGACFLTAMGPIFALGLLMHPSFLRAGVGPTAPPASEASQRAADD